MDLGQDLVEALGQHLGQVLGQDLGQHLAKILGMVLAKILAKSLVGSGLILRSSGGVIFQHLEKVVMGAAMIALSACAEGFHRTNQ